MNEAGITVVTHIGATRHDSNGYDVKNIDLLSLGPRPSVTNFHRARNINDFLASMVFDRLFERFPNLRIASVENGAEFLGDLLRALDRTRERVPATSRRIRSRASGSTSGSTPSGRTTSPRWSSTWGPIA